MSSQEHLPESILRQGLTNIWRGWYSRICELLEIETSISVNAQPLRKPWFLIPIRSELQEEEADELIQCARTYLYSHGKSMREVRGRLTTLQPEMSLPFLYLMRYIAFRDAGKYDYWPAFRKAVFLDELSYNDVALGLAPTLSNLWIRLYYATNGALYYPREGSRHIKWPLAHAGLIADDKAVLTAFGYDLLESDNNLYPKALSLETEELILLFRDWLRDNSEYSGSRFAHLLEGGGVEREVIAELCQQWLASHQEKLEESRHAKDRQTRQVIPLHRHLTYNAQTNQLGLIFEVGRLTNAYDIKLKWNGREFQFRWQSIDSTGEIIPLPLFIAVEQPNWPTTAQLVIDSTTHTISVPSLESSRSIVFDQNSGVHTTRWELGQEYYILINGTRLKPERASHVFQDWIGLGTPQGEWDQYTVLWVRTKDPVSSIGEDARDITTILEDLEEAVAEMHLPSFGHQYRIRASLIGGQFTGQGTTGIPTFSSIRPPYLEVRGIWNTDTEILWTVLDDASGQYLPLSKLVIDCRYSGTNPIVELWEYQAESGQYRLEIEGNVLDFVVKPSSSENWDADIVPFEFGAQFADIWGNTVVNPSRYSLAELSLSVVAWPYAELILEIECRQAMYSRKLSIQTDEDGHYFQQLGELPVDYSAFPPGHLIFRMSWRGVFNCELQALDKTHTSAGDLEADVQFDDDEYIFKCRGLMEGCAASQNYSGLLLAQIPWQQAPARFPLIFEGSRFSGGTRLSWPPAWVVIVAEDTSQQEEIIPITVSEVRNNLFPVATEESYDLAAILDAHSVVWTSLARRISTAPHPPSLDSYLEIEPLLSLLVRTNALSKLQPVWKFFAHWEDLERVHDCVKRGSSLALFLRNPPQGETAQQVGGVEFDFSSLAGITKELPFRFHGSGWESGGKLVQTSVFEEGRFGLELMASLHGCSKCQLIIPGRGFLSHVTPYTELEDCNSIGPAFHILKPGQSYVKSVTIGAYIDPSYQFEAIQQQLKKILDGNSQPSPLYRALIERLRSLVPAETGSREWLQGLLVATDEYRTITRNKSVQFERLVRSAKAVSGYESALEMILDAVEA